MKKPVVADSIVIIAKTEASADQVKASIHLRGFDRVKCYSLDQAAGVLTDYPVDLVIMDPEGDYPKALGLMTHLDPSVPVIFMAEEYNENIFLTCFDAGAKDFLIKPVEPSYLASRVLVALDSRRIRDLLQQRDVILKEMAAIGKYSNVFATEYFVKMLRREVERLAPESLPPLSLMVIQLAGFNTRLAVNPEFKKMLYETAAKLLLSCCRGSDIVGEYFEDKLAVILPNTGMKGVHSVSERVMTRLNGRKLLFESEEVSLIIHIGSADFSGCIHYEDLLNKAMENLKQTQSDSGKVPMS